MDYRKLYDQGTDYLGFIESDTVELKDKALKRLESCEVRDEHENIMKKMRNTYVLAFMELYSPDCMVAAPILKKMHEINYRIQYAIVPRVGNEIYMKEFVDDEGVPPVPTFLIFNEDFKLKGAYVEFPKKIKEKIQTGELDHEEAVRNYRFGQFNDEIFEEVLGIMRK